VLRRRNLKVVGSTRARHVPSVEITYCGSVNRRFPVIVLLASALIGACGGDAKVDPKADQAAADKAVAAWEKQVKKDGFKKKDNSDSSDSSDDDISFTSKNCKDFAKVFPKKGEKDDTLTVDTDGVDFVKGEFGKDDTEETVTASVIFGKANNDVEEKFKLLNDDRMPDCLKEAFNTSFKKGDTFDKVDLKVATKELGKIGDERVGYQVTGSLTAGSEKLKVGFTFLFARKGRAGASLVDAVIGADKPDADLEGQLTLLLDTQTAK
jgi:hypothetical protein